MSVQQEMDEAREVIENGVRAPLTSEELTRLLVHAAIPRSNWQVLLFMVIYTAWMFWSF